MRRLLRLLHPLLTLACLSCCGYLLWKDRRLEWWLPDQGGPGRMSREADRPLRVFTQMKWLGGDYELPAGEDHCAVVLLHFEDGQLKGRLTGSTWSVPPGAPRVVRYMVMWGPSANGTRWVAYGEDGFVMHTGGDNHPLFADLTGGASRCYGATHAGEVLGYRVIGHAISKGMQAGQEQYANQNGNLDHSLKTRKTVLVMGVKPFPTRDEAQDWVLNGREPKEPKADG